MTKLPHDEHDFSESQVDSETVYRGRMLHVKFDHVRQPDGHVATREYILHPGAVVIVPALDRDTILLEYQFRYPLRRHFYELPAGKLEAGEEPRLTAERELLEETGYRAARWDHLTTMHPCIGYSDEKIDLYVARDMTFEGHRRDHGEFLETLEVSLDEALRWVQDGRITDTKTALGLLWYRTWVRDRA